MRPTPGTADTDVDQFIYLRVDWKGFDQFLRLKGDANVPRITYQDGVLELMSPSTSHEGIGRAIGRLIEAWADENGIELNSYGSWTLKNKPLNTGIEPDGCYVVGLPERVPDLAIEVVWTRGGLDKLAAYHRLEVPEVWTWIDDTLQVHLWRPRRYLRSPRSRLLPGLDVKLIERLCIEPNQSRAVKTLRAAIRRH